MGPRYRQRLPLPINRVQTLLVKWAVAAVAAPLLTGILLLVSVGALGMHAPRLLALVHQTVEEELRTRTLASGAKDT
jgi:hypothetical protein